MATEPITKAEAKEHMNIETAFTEDDDYIDALIVVARKQAEQWTRRKFITETITGYLTTWPRSDSICLPYGQLQSVASVKYTDTAGAQSTFSSANYTVETTEPGRIVLNYGEQWPTVTLGPSNPIEIIWDCGYGAAGANVDDLIIHALKIMVADLYENREDIIVGTISKSLKVAEYFCLLKKYWHLSKVVV